MDVPTGRNGPRPGEKYSRKGIRDLDIDDQLDALVTL